MNKSLFPYSPKNPILYLLTFNFFQVLYVQTGSVYWASTSQSNDLAYSMYFVVGEKHRGVLHGLIDDFIIFEVEI